MRSNLMSMRFYETYYYANIVSNIFEDTGDYLRNLNEWYVDYEAEILLPPFPKWSRFHSLIAHIINSIIHEEISDTSIDAVVNDKRYEVWVDRALKYHQLECQGFRNWLVEQSITFEELNEDHLSDYHLELYESGMLEELVEQISKEVFFVLFNNRKLLARFNWFVAGTVRRITEDEVLEEFSNLIERPGMLKRVAIPEWVKRAVFYRDRGMCALCAKDISGLVSSQPDKHFDHIIPLSEGGINDVTNIQLLCEACNLSKGAKYRAVSNVYEAWY